LVPQLVLGLLAVAFFLALFGSLYWWHFVPKVSNKSSCCIWPTDRLPLSAGSLLSLEATTMASRSRSLVHSSFERYDAINSAVPTWIVSTLNRPVGGNALSERGREDTIHRFFDSSPFSPSGRFVAAVRLPPPQFSREMKHQMASVIVIDLIRGKEHTVAHTLAWGAQLGAQAQWGSSDSELFYNQLQRHGGQIEGVVYNMEARKITQVLPCPIYHVSQDGKFTAAPNMRKIRNTQYGYGADYVDEPSSFLHTINYNASKTDGLFVNNIATRQCHLLVSLFQFAVAAGLDTERTPTYGFHTKWSHDGTHLLFVMRSLEQASGVNGMLLGHLVRRQHLFVVRANDSRIWYLLSWSSKPFKDRSIREKGLANNEGMDALEGMNESGELEVDANHPNWVAGSLKVSLNVKLRGHASEKWRIVVFDANSDKPLNTKTLLQGYVYAPGSGHPNFAVGGRFLMLDVYAKERASFGSYHLSNVSKSASGILRNGGNFAPLRLVDIRDKREVWLLHAQLVPNTEHERRQTLVHNEAPNKEKRAWRCDMHPAFSRGGDWVAFNARPHGSSRELLISYIGTDLTRLFPMMHHN